jgi:tRNA threonylcarbamoyl adenosine modification protein YeaZ
MLILAFDTATSVATAALVDGDETVAERTTQPRRLLEDVDALLRQGGLQAAALEGVVVGTGPGSFTSLRMGLSAARALGLALDIPAAGVSTLDALAAGASGARPVIDARRREVFTVAGRKPVAVAPAELELEAGEVCVGDGAVRYREIFEAAGADVPPDESDLHVPRASIHVRLAGDFGPADEIEPVYVRVPDAERSLA